MQKDLELERALLKWLEMVAGKKAHNESFERWIQDGTVVARVRPEGRPNINSDRDGKIVFKLSTLFDRGG